MSGRRRPARGTDPLAVVAVAMVLMLVAVRLAPLLLMLAVAIGAGYTAGRLHRPAPPRPRRKAAPAPPRRRVAPGDARARKNGWLPPLRPATVTVTVSPECAEGACAICPETGCGCLCGHNARVIVAMNEARTDTDEIPY